MSFGVVMHDLGPIAAALSSLRTDERAYVIHPPGLFSAQLLNRSHDLELAVRIFVFP